MRHIVKLANGATLCFDGDPNLAIVDKLQGMTREELAKLITPEPVTDVELWASKTHEQIIADMRAGFEAEYRDPDWQAMQDAVVAANARSAFAQMAADNEEARRFFAFPIAVPKTSKRRNKYGSTYGPRK